MRIFWTAAAVIFCGISGSEGMEIIRHTARGDWQSYAGEALIGSGYLALYIALRWKLSPASEQLREWSR